MSDPHDNRPEDDTEGHMPFSRGADEKRPEDDDDAEGHMPYIIRRDADDETPGDGDDTDTQGHGACANR